MVSKPISRSCVAKLTERLPRRAHDPAAAGTDNQYLPDYDDDIHAIPWRQDAATDAGLHSMRFTGPAADHGCHGPHEMQGMRLDGSNQS
jgi:hypothetical protein